VIFLVELQDLFWRPIPGFDAIGLHDPLTNSDGPKPLTFQFQKGQFGRGVDDSERRIELQAINDDGLGLQTDMLRAKVAVTIDDPARAYALIEQFRVLVDAPYSLGTYPLRELRGQLKLSPLKLHAAAVELVQ
jgi:hypothetical protein